MNPFFKLTYPLVIHTKKRVLFDFHQTALDAYSQ